MVAIVGQYKAMRDALAQQRKRMLDETAKLMVYCLACHKTFMIDDYSEDMVYCCEDHRIAHARSCAGKEIGIMDFELKTEPSKCGIGKQEK